jgi:hypothetical protein
MPIGANTKNNIGLRRVVASLTPPAERCFEVNGSQQYRVITGHGYFYAGTVYAQGATIPYDAAGGTKYGAWPQLQRDWNLGWIDPLD